MLKKIDGLISLLFYCLAAVVPLVLFPKTSEVFEFNKIVIVYIMTVLITGLWIIKMILAKKIVFKKTLLDIPIFLFLTTQGLSTLISIEIRTSIFGYYSRFHGGLLSSISYTLLYWTYVSNMDRYKSKKFLNFLLGSGVVVSIWAILEHTGHSLSCLIFPGFENFDVSCWDQDVKNRVFATLGQPNWLAAWMVAIIPITWAYGIFNLQLPISKLYKINKLQIHKKLFWIGLSVLFFLTLLFTKSRSGLLGFIAADVVFLLGLVWVTVRNNMELSGLLRKLVSYHFIFGIIILIFGTPWTQSLFELRTGSQPTFEVGGTESGKIRQIVWKGTLDIWKNHPLFGSGVETFAFSFSRYKPIEHNLTSEWNYLYNKAHNEYLNMAATTGTVGLAAYLVLISSIAFLYIKQLKTQNSNVKTTTKNLKSSLAKFSNLSYGFEFSFLNLALLAGYFSMLITNFFGFSVVPVALLFFLFPAIAVTLEREGVRVEERESKRISSTQWVLVFVLNSFTLLLLYSIGKYWYSDFLYAKGIFLYDSENYTSARDTLFKAVKMSPKEGFYWNRLSLSTSALATLHYKNNEKDVAEKLAESALTESSKAIVLSPNNIIFRKAKADIFLDMSNLNPDYLNSARQLLLETTNLAPTDAHLRYNLALAYLRTGDENLFLQTIKAALELKPNYKDARLTLANFYKYKEMPELELVQLEYILSNIGPDESVKKELERLK